MVKPVAVLVIFSLLLSACATGSGSSSRSSSALALTPQEAAVRRDQEAFTKTVVQGVAAGAATGALIGGLAGRSWQGALIGLAAGALAGGLAGSYIANKQSEYANAEQRTNSMIADVRTDNIKLANYVQNSRAVIRNDRQRLESLNARYAAGQLQRDEAEVQLARIRENREVIGETVEGLKERREEYAKAANVTRREGEASNIADLDAQIGQLNQNIRALEAELTALDTALAVSPVA